MCGWECCISAKSIHLSLLSWRDRYLKKSRIKDKIIKTEGIRKKKICIHETYKNRVTPHGSHIYAKASDTAKEGTCAYPQSDCGLTHWTCVIRCCAKCQSINISYQETYYQCSNTSPSICFHIYYQIARCAAHGRLSLNEKKSFRKCKQDSV